MIQEALLYFGVWAPQRFIHAAGRSSHPDLYSDEVPVALQQLGVVYDFYAPKGGGFEAYKTWTRHALEAGYPVLSGVKILPTEHPNWGLDHFVLTVGHGDSGLLVNTTWGNRQWVSDTATKGLSFRNVSYGIRLTGVRSRPNARAARLTVISETATSVRLRVECPSMPAGARGRVERRSLPSDKEPSWSSEGTGPVEVTIEADRPARFQCVSGAS